MITMSQAQLLVSIALEIATKQNVAIAVSVCDGHGELVCFTKMDGCGLPSITLAQNKAYTSARERQPCGNLGTWARETGKDLGYWTDPKVTGFKGGLPIINNDDVIGGIGVSGLSEEEDEALAEEVLGLANIS
ncbi:GlcG/HbpS family heme-binding protein [Echinimonas agarilytica]|uniref:Heme-binding protein n=1 Tax=Echinimonas agarilytica TaxID=1215918 RepID=A0AA41W573_9GAMM|nr:heme-binding protein [Echinimonas agarilytica]MCM2678860.1 heme-binding protein [Echinimonas agarilytica]